MIIALTVGRNEEDRYLKSMLENTQSVAARHFFWDDQSTDDTYRIALNAGCVVRRRRDNIPSFIDDEGMFRQAAWDTFETLMKPTTSDWILVIDCDEFIAGVDLSYIPGFLKMEMPAVNLNIPEVFGFDTDGCPLVRVDRLWGTIHAPRLFRYRPGGVYAQGGFGVPAVPSYVMSTLWGVTDEFGLVHFGYAKEQDQKAKYDRYVGHAGHSNAHVESILAQDKILQRLEYWKGSVPWKQLTS